MDKHLKIISITMFETWIPVGGNPRSYLKLKFTVNVNRTIRNTIKQELEAHPPHGESGQMISS